MTYEEKMRMLSICRPEKKDELLLRLAKGEVIDLTKDSDLFYQINADRMSMDDWMKQDKFNVHKADMRRVKDSLADKGKTKGGKFRLIGEIPAEVYFNRPEFSPLLPPQERARNIKKFLNDFPTFKV